MTELELYLGQTLAIHPSIIKYFTSRPVPADNDYWRNQSTYTSKALGYLFIPIFFDLLFRQNEPIDRLLSDDLMRPMEDILQSAAKFEFRKMDEGDHIEECRNILRGLGISEAQIANVEKNLVRRNFTLIPSRFHSLRRANTFLYTFANSDIDTALIFESWENTVPLFLVLDDFQDIRHDLANHEENCLLDQHSIQENFFELNRVLDAGLARLSKVNPLLSESLLALKKEAVARNLIGILTVGIK